MTLKEVSNWVEIDSKIMTVTDSLGNVDNAGSFPEMKLGINSIKWTGTVTKFEIIKRELFRG